jgi:hypothetical protein
MNQRPNWVYDLVEKGVKIMETPQHYLGREIDNQK